MKIDQLPETGFKLVYKCTFKEDPSAEDLINEINGGTESD